MYYYAGFSAWYQAGLDGKAESQVRGPYAGTINEAQRVAAYNSGQRDAELSLAKEKAAAPYAKTAGTEAGLVYDEYVAEAVETSQGLRVEETIPSQPAADSPFQKGPEGQVAWKLTAEVAVRINTVAKALGVRVRLVDHIDAGTTGANGGYSGSDILIAKDAADPVAQVFGHEITHRMQELAPEQFRVFRQAAMDHMADSAARAKIDDYRARGMTIQYEAAMDDVTADYAGQLMENGQVLDEFIDRHRTDRTLLEKLRDAFRRLVAKLTGAEKRKAQTAEGKLSAALDAAAEQAGKLQPGTGSQTAEGEVKYSIKETEGGKKYVQADRQVIFGNDPASWGEQLEDYINGKIRRGGNVQLIAEDGEVLTLTATTAGKLASPYTSRGTTLSDDTYYTKVNAGAHIDEIAQISEVKGKPRPDTDARHGDFASGGWQYRTAYFQDFDGKYYRLSISVARGSGGNVVYNIGDIQERSFPNTTDLTANGSSAKGGALGVEKASSDTTVPQSGEESKTQYSLKGATITKTYNQLLKENDALRERVNYWRGQTKTTKTVTTDKKSVEKAAKGLSKEYGSDLDTGELAGRLQTLYDAMATGMDGKNEIGPNYAWEQAEQIARDIASSAAGEWSLSSEFPGLKEKLRDTPITIGHEYDGDIRNENFRREYRGKLKLSAQGMTNVDAVYAELAESYPGLFPEDITHPADQLEQIMDVVDNLYTVETQSRFSGQMEEAVTGITNEIVEQFFDLPQTKATMADRYEAQLDAAKAHGKQRVAETREQYQDRMQELRAQNREAVRNAIAKERAAREKQVKALKTKYKARTEAGRERQKAGELRQKITRHAKSLSDKLLHPTDKAHIPEELRGPVAKVLESINLESRYTIDPDTAHYAQRKDGKQGGLTGKHLTGDEEARGILTKRTQAFLELKQKYAEINKNGGDLVIDPDLLGSDAEGIQGSLDAVIAMGDTRIADMNSGQLNTVWQVLKSVEHSVSTAGKLLNQAKYERTGQWADALKRDTATRRNKRTLTERHPTMDLENPYTFFSHFGQAGKDMYRTLRNAQDRQQLLTNQVAEAVEKVVGGEGKKARQEARKQVNDLEKATHDFTTENGQKLTLSTAQVMELYELSKREQALEHLLTGGIVQPKVNGTKVRRGTDAIHLTMNDLANITGVLTADEIRIADGLQEIAATMLADMGNEASMTAYGYKKFTEKHYWPIRSAREGLHSNIEKGGDNTRSIKNIGMAQATVPHANNQVDIGSIFDTFARHTGDMVDYAAWLVPMEDLNRVYNYQYRDGEGKPTGKTVKGLLDDKGGAGAQKYWHDLMEDIQNGIKPKSDSAFGDLASKGVGSFKASAVGGNIRVIMQQPTAFFRALAVMNPADMTLGLAKGATKGFGWQKAKQYSPIAMRKDAGGFDISSPGTMNETLFGKTGAVNRINDFMGKGAGAADAFTWGKLWNASEWQVARQHKELAKGSRAYYEEVNRVFTDMIDQTQVVDGVLQRANIMRSSNAMVQQATSFMGEPIMSLNLTMRAWDQMRNEQDSKKRSKAMKNLARAVTALIVTDAVNALAQSLIDGLRDDDKDKKYSERFWSAFHGQEGDEESDWERALSFVLNGNLGQGLNPANRIPYVKDVMSILQGYDVSRAEFSVIEDIVEAGQSFIKSAVGTGPRTMPYALNKLFASAAKMFGLPVSNVERDIWAIGRSIVTEVGNLPLQYEMEKAIYNIGSEKNKSRFTDIMYRALEAGEIDTYLHIQDELMNVMGVDGAALESAMKSHYKDKLEKNPAYSLSQRAYDLLGIRPGSNGKEDSDSFGVDNLNSEAFKEYTTQRAADYREAEDALASNPIFKGMDQETRDKVLQAAFDMAKDWALEDASDGQYTTDKEWIAYGREAEKKGIEPWEYSIWNVTKNDTTDVKDESGKKVKGETRKDQLSDWLEMSDLSEDQREFLWGMEYTDDYGDYRDDLAEYRSYGLKMDAAYSEMTDALADNPIFTGMDKETRDKVTEAAMKVAKQTAQAEVIEDFEYDGEWIERTGEAKSMGIAPEDYVLWHVVFENTKSDYGDNDKPIKGREKKDKVRDWLNNFDGLTYNQKLWLWRTEYSPKTPF